MDTNTLINPNKISDLRLDLALRASDALLVCRPDATAAVSGALMAAPGQPRVSYDPQPQASNGHSEAGVPAPINQVRIEGSDKGLWVGTTHRMSTTRGKAATKFSTRLGRRTCSPPV